MAIKIEDLDALLKYDPETHSVSGLPSLMQPTPENARRNELSALVGMSGERTAHPAPRGIPSVGEAPAPEVAAPTPAGIPSLEREGIPSLAPPKSERGFWGKLGHGLATAGNVAGNIVAPGTMELIPGTQLHKEFEEARGSQLAGEKSTQELQQAEAANQRAQAEKNKEPGSAWKPLGQPQQDPTTGAWSQAVETRDASGQPRVEWQPLTGGPAAKPTVEKAPSAEENKQWMARAEQKLSTGNIDDEERTRLAGLQRSEKMSGVAPEIVSQIGDAPVPADYPGGKKDPKYIAANKQWGGDYEAIKNREAGAQGAARAQAFGEFRPVQVIDPQTGELKYQFAKTAIEQGAAPVAGGMKAMSAQAQIADIKNASDKVREALKAGGNANFTPSQVAKLSLAMQESDPGVMHNEIANLAASGMTPTQQDLVTWLYQLNERALSLRNIAGMGQGSDTTRLAILKALPSITSGNTEMAIKQLDAFDNMVMNLEKGIGKIKRTGEAAPAGGGSPSVKDWLANRKK